MIVDFMKYKDEHSCKNCLYHGTMGNCTNEGYIKSSLKVINYIMQGHTCPYFKNKDLKKHESNGGEKNI